MARIVIMGGGPAGYEAALVAAQHGSDVTVVERHGMGGACVLDDCVPSKTFIASAGIRVELHRAPELGLTADREAVGVDLPTVNARVRGLARPSRPTSGPGSSGRASGSSGARPRSPGARRPGRRTSSRRSGRTAEPRSCPPTSC